MVSFWGRKLILGLVAHRLRTVIDYDRLIVLDHGQVCALSLLTSLPLIASNATDHRDW